MVLHLARISDLFRPVSEPQHQIDTVKLERNRVPRVTVTRFRVTPCRMCTLAQITIDHPVDLDTIMSVTNVLKVL